MFDYALPDAVVAASKGGTDDKNDKKKDDKQKGKGETVQTQMLGEKPGDDLGYDPKKIPVEEIPDD
jgi:hypothetical protein